MLVSDPNTGCKVYIDSGERAGSGVKWDGACTTDKYANGDGTLWWTAGGKVYFVAHFVKRGGLIMENGHILVDIPDDAMTVTFDFRASQGVVYKKCGGVTVTAIGDVYVAYPPVLNSLVNKLVEQYKSACPEEWQKRGGYTGIRMLYRDNADKDAGFAGSVDPNGKLTLNYDRALYASKIATEKANRQIEAVAKQQRAEQEKQQQEQAQRTLDQKLQAFAAKYGALGWIKWETLLANPFSAEGKVYLFNAEFTRMITPTSGIFNDIVVSDVPRNAFTTPTKTLLAGKVLGTTNIKNQLGGEVSVPHVRYLGHVACRDPDCEGYFRGRLR